MTEQESGVARPPYPREPNVHSGGEQEPDSGGRLIPPYDDRQKTGQSPEELAQKRGGAGKSDVGPREVSQEETGGMEATDIEPPVQHGVGETTTTSGEDLMRGTSEEARREERVEGGIGGTGGNGDPPDSPVARTGDQGG
jgi:hypothetical protein